MFAMGIPGWLWLAATLGAALYSSLHLPAAGVIIINCTMELMAFAAMADKGGLV